MRSTHLRPTADDGSSHSSVPAASARRDWRSGGASEIVEAEDTDVWLVELANVADRDGMASTIAAGLGLPVSSDPKADLARIVDFLCGRSTLVVIDNCEHLIEAAARVGTGAPGALPEPEDPCHQPGGIGCAERVGWPVPPLSLDDAVILFAERGAAAAPDSDLVVGNEAEGT